MSVRLPVIDAKPGSLRADGSRNWVHPADVRGPFTRLRRGVFVVLIAFYAALPWVEIGGFPAVFFDIEHRRFYLFGATFNAQDVWLTFFFVTGAVFLLIVLTAALGRVWCGYACPQTVFLEGVYRRIERLLEGPRAERLRRNSGPLSFGFFWRKGIKHVLFVAFSLLVTHLFLSYFVSLPALFEMVQRSPGEHPEAFGWVMGISAAMYLNFAFFREQLCLVVCPYGRLQSVLTDRDSIVIGYDVERGEPRGKAKDPDAGDCVDCKRCVVVCPTGIDIRQGLQLDCIGCGSCVDACDEIMGKLGRDRGLVRYDSLNGLERKQRRFWRPRFLLYAGLGLLGLVVASFSLQSWEPFDANLLRLPGPPFIVAGDEVLNRFEVHVINKHPHPVGFTISPADSAVLRYAVSVPDVHLVSLEDAHVPVIVTVDRADLSPDLSIEIAVGPGDCDHEAAVLTAPFLGPAR